MLIGTSSVARSTAFDLWSIHLIEQKNYNRRDLLFLIGCPERWPILFMGELSVVLLQASNSQ